MLEFSIIKFVNYIYPHFKDTAGFNYKDKDHFEEDVRDSLKVGNLKEQMIISFANAIDNNELKSAKVIINKEGELFSFSDQDTIRLIDDREFIFDKLKSISYRSRHILSGFNMSLKEELKKLEDPNMKRISENIDTLVKDFDSMMKVENNIIDIDWSKRDQWRKD